MVKLTGKNQPAAACSVAPAEIQIDGIAPGADLAAARSRWGAPVTETAGESGGRLPRLTFANGIAVIHKQDRIVSIEVRKVAGIALPRQVAVGDRCEVITERFGPGHENGIYLYETAKQAVSLTFLCDAGRVAGAVLSLSAP